MRVAFTIADQALREDLVECRNHLQVASRWKSPAPPFHLFAAEPPHIMTDINRERLMGDLRKLAEFGKHKTGVDRIAFSEADIAARRWLCGRLAESGLSARLDRYGNVLGRAPEVARAALIGSHTDSVPAGGWLDGALGVIYGLEIARSLREGGIRGVDVISFQDEEGTYVPCLGSKAFCGVLAEKDLSKATGPGRKPVTDAMQGHDLPTEILRLDPTRHTAFFEAHIEQGPRLEAAGCPVGVVTGIVGIRRFRVTASGQPDHAGTTPMSMRHDAGAALIAAAQAILNSFQSLAELDTVWNIGAMSFSPGAANVVPAEAMMIVEFRDTDAAMLDRLEASFSSIIESHSGKNGVMIAVAGIGQVHPVALDQRLGQHIAAAASARGIKPMFMPSGAGHDAMVLGSMVPSAMMFVPSIGGRSHTVLENTSDDDIVIGCQVLAGAVKAHLRDS